MTKRVCHKCDTEIADKAESRMLHLDRSSLPSVLTEGKGCVGQT